jgi:hypothetical protein
MTTHKEALTLALEALNTNRVMTKDSEGNYTREITPKLIVKAITAIKEALAQPEQPKVRTGDCLLVGVYASEGHKIQKAQPEHEKYCPICQGVGQVDTGIMESPVTICNACNGTGLKAQPEQEPVAVLFEDGSIVKYEDLEFVPEKSGQRVQMLYTTPPQRTWVGLTDEDLRELGFTSRPRWWPALEAKLKEKNT